MLTSSTSTGATVAWADWQGTQTHSFEVHHECMIDPASRRGSNQHQAVERGVCRGCGAVYERRIDWRTRRIGGWERKGES